MGRLENPVKLRLCMCFAPALNLAVILTAVLLSPLSLSTQISSFSLALDLDGSEGDQAVHSLAVSPNQDVFIQIFGTDIQGAIGLFARFEYGATQVVYKGFDVGDVLPNAQALFEQDATSVQVNIASLGGSATVNTGLIGTLRFRTTDAFSGTEIWLVGAELGGAEQSETVNLSVSVVLHSAASLSPDFDGSGTVDIPDFLLFVDAFGSKEGQAQYGARYDLDGDGEIGVGDFLIFVDSFGKVVNRVPVFTVDSDDTTPMSSVTFSVAENTPSGMAVGVPLSATDADGDALTYSLQGAYADSFAIDASTGQIKTRGTYDFERKSNYSVIVRVSDGEGGRASLVVHIAITDIFEPTATAPSNVVVENGDSKLTVRWDAVPNEAGKPPVIGYKVGYRERPYPSDAPGEESDEWAGIQTVSSRLDTSVTITELLNGQEYLVSVRTLTDGGGSEWSSPVLGIPVISTPPLPPPSSPPPGWQCDH